MGWRGDRAVQGCSSPGLLCAIRPSLSIVSRSHRFGVPAQTGEEDAGRAFIVSVSLSELLLHETLLQFELPPKGQAGDGQAEQAERRAGYERGAEKHAEHGRVDRMANPAVWAFLH